MTQSLEESISYISKFRTGFTDYLKNDEIDNKSPTTGDLLVYLHYSLLTGEYIFNYSEIVSLKIASLKLDDQFSTDSEGQNQLQKIIENLKRAKKNGIPISIKKIRSLEKKDKFLSLKEENKNFILKYLTIYSLFTLTLKENLEKLCTCRYDEIIEFDLPKHLLREVLEKGEDSPKLEESNLLGDLFIISLFVAYYDENLESDEWCFEKLKELKNFLFNKKARFNYIKIEPIFQILQSKIDYLIFKIKYRKEEKRNLLIDEEGNTKMEDGKKIEEISPLFISKENHYFTFFKKNIRTLRKEY